MSRDDSQTGVVAVILAAGASSRLGEPKQLARLAGERLLERAVRIALEAGCHAVLVVLGAGAETVMESCNLSAARVVINDVWHEGMASSIRASVAALVQTESGGWEQGRVILMTCDQPAVTPDHLQALMAAAVDGPAASAYMGRRGVPACFPASCFEELLTLRGDEGARRLLESARTVDLPGGELDIDTPATLKAARELYS